MINLSDPSLLLGDSELEVINEVSRFLKAGIPSTDMEAERLKYASESIRLQEEISNLKSMITYSRSIYWKSVCESESEALEDIREEYSRVADQNRALYLNSKVVDVRKTYDAMDTLIDRLNSMEWNLKGVFRAVS